MAGMSAIDWVLVDHSAADDVQVGDVLSTDAGGMPAYRVVAMADGRVWLRDDQHPFDRILPLGLLHWKVRRAS
jgi:hypothetical protein